MVLLRGSTVCIHVHSAGIFLEKIPVGHMEDFYTLQGRRKLFHSVCVGEGGGWPQRSAPMYNNCKVGYMGEYSKNI